MKITDYNKVQAFKSGNVFLIDGPDGTKSINADDVFFALLDAFSPPEHHRNIFRGKNLGGSVTAEQKSAIQNGSFKGLFVGDHWVIGGVNWRIADMDYFYRCGDSDFTRHHLVIVPDSALYNAQMNTENITTGGYMGSKMYTENLANAKSTISSAFGELVLTHRDYFVNAVTDGRPSAGVWTDSTVELMNEIMVYGGHVYAPMNDGVAIPNKYTPAKQQLALFALDPKMVNRRYTYWLRDVVSAANFACVYYCGGAFCYSASSSCGVRPYFIIG